MKNENEKSGTVQDLEKLQSSLGPDSEPDPENAGLPPGFDPESLTSEDLAVSPQELAAGIIEYANNELRDFGLTPINTIQKLLLRMSIIGFSKKHKIEKYDVNTYPEIALIISSVWITVTKYREFKALRAKKEADKKPEAQTGPEPAIV